MRISTRANPRTARRHAGWLAEFCFIGALATALGGTQLRSPARPDCSTPVGPLPSPPASAAQVRQLMQDLAACAGRLASMEPPRDSAPENATLAVAQLFLNFSATDRLFVNETASNFAKYCWHKTPQASDFALARRLPDLELSQTAVVLRQAISECELVAAGGYRPPTRQAPSHTSLDNGIGYLTDGEGVPFFPMGYSQYPGFDGSVHDATLSSLGVSLGEAYFTPGMILSATGCCNISEARLQSIVAQARTASTRATTLQVSIGNGQAPHSYVFPAWAEEMCVSVWIHEYPC